MEMRVQGVQVSNDGTREILKVVYFSDTDGNTVKFPWEKLKHVVHEWVEVEQRKKKGV